MNVVKGALKLKGKHNQVIQSLKKKRDAPVLQAMADKQKEELKEYKLKLEKEQKKLEDQFEKELIRQGSGRIVTSGTVIRGTDTRFLKEVRIGDYLIVETKEGVEEQKCVKMVLSDESVGIEEPFSRDFSLEVRYKIKTWKKTERRLEEGEEMFKKRVAKEEKAKDLKRDQKMREKLILGRVKIEKVVTKTEEEVEKRRKSKHDRHAY